MSSQAARRALQSVSAHSRGLSRSSSGLSISRRRASLSMVLSLWGSASAAALGPRMLSSHWAKVPLAPPDKILGLSESFKSDTFPGKIDLGVGAYRDDNGKPMVLQSVRAAERLIAAKNCDHEYAGIAGINDFVRAALEFAYSAESVALKENRVAGMQSLSGTGACRVLAEFISQTLGKGTKVFISAPTWPNHFNLLRQAGLVPEVYPYYNAASKSFDYKAMSAFVRSAPDGSVFLLHACAHNPTGCDPSHEEWNALSTLMKEKGHVVFFDCAYQGFASGDADRDAYAIRKFVADGHNILLAQSFAKNFGLYGERIGAVSVVAADVQERDRVLSQLKQIARAMYSNPPVYGARIVSEILNTPALKTQWTTECKAMADRIQSMRTLLKQNILGLNSRHNWDHITNQIGMFCYTGLSTEQVLEVRSKHHIYFTDDGRISVAGVTTKNARAIAEAFHSVTNK